ncbi:TetR/AcrR family transcriptional regulator [Mycobacterium sp. NAZ190054]|uniref:TetR/AcrR family transcriptional regulator n=1 Tax=Mycobacterium sp. NAZ190054 TaxID=1747766 RepID=UPI0007969482|nr:TetR/AcrR family transcriptional regulator [Mycobacterium sp. NAZ190054]KWX69219.1 TetR family transcriptional regulator [Mycobacterium sp. NAZ190054]
MGAVASREAFFEAGLDVLSDLGYGGLKLAEVCDRLGVTTGSFYHYFSNWPAFTQQLVAHWHEGMTLQIVEASQAETDPRRRIDRLIDAALALPHSAEAAIRVWSAVDPQVRSVQEAVDRQRFDVMYHAALEILQQPRQAELFAAWALYLLVGYEQAILPADATGLRWIGDQLLGALDTGLFTSVPGRE